MNKLVVAATTGLAAGVLAIAPAQAQSPTPVAPVGNLVPETGSAGMLNNLLCSLQSLSAEIPCRHY